MVIVDTYVLFTNSDRITSVWIEGVLRRAVSHTVTLVLLKSEFYL